MIIPRWHTRPFRVYHLWDGQPGALPLAEITGNAHEYTFRVHCSARGKSGIDNAFDDGYADHVADSYISERAADFDFPARLSLLIWPEGAPEQMRHILARSRVVYETALQPFTPPATEARR